MIGDSEMTQEETVNFISGATFINMPEPGDGRVHSRLHDVHDMLVKWINTFAAVQDGKLEGIPREMDLVSVGLLAIHVPDLIERLIAANQLIRTADRLHNETHGPECNNPHLCMFVERLENFKASGNRHQKSAHEMTMRVDAEMMKELEAREKAADALE